MQSVQNLGLALISLLTGYIVDEAGYFVLEIFFLGSLCLALIGGILLFFIDNIQGISNFKNFQMLEDIC
jgi:hypothetical protein